MRPNKEAIEFDNSVENAVKKYLNNKQAYCMYPGCNMHAISSHTISKKISLNQISENGILFSPESKRMYPEKKYGIGEIGINDASTFKGFCKIHDEIFFSVDKNGIKSQKDVFLQVYRVLNFIIFNENVINKMAPLFYEKLNTSLKNENIKKIIERGKNTATEANEIRIKKLNKYSSNILNIINAGGLNSATFDEEAFLTLDITMDQDIQENSHNKNEDNLIIVHRKVNYHIPVAMATKVSFSLNTQGKEDELFLICIPYENYSDLIIMFAKGKSLFAKNNHYLHYIYNDLNMLELIEKTMVNSEDWWMSPREWY
ncbi:hypothetical protein [Paenibacillus ottowii]|uniref:hypothetical protein n=1 Tax=Paenibacillus ottowii TaxID=2315729 RepID=UPI003D2F4B1D